MFPERKVVVLPFVFVGKMVRAISASFCDPDLIVFNINDVLDPSAGFGTRKPFYSTQWATFFSRYQVLGVKWAVTGYCDSTTNTGTDTYLTARVLDDSIATTVVNTTAEVLENRGFQKRSMRISHSNQSKSVTLSGYARMSDFLKGVPIADRQAVTTASPANKIQLKVGYANAYGGDAVSADVDIHLIIRLTMTVMYFHPIIQNN